jgi:hypothetical protein
MVGIGQSFLPKFVGPESFHVVVAGGSVTSRALVVPPKRSPDSAPVLACDGCDIALPRVEHELEAEGLHCLRTDFSDRGVYQLVNRREAARHEAPAVVGDGALVTAGAGGGTLRGGCHACRP